VTERPFLSVMTRFNGRPNALYRNVASLAAQTNKNYEQVFIHDGESRGIAWANEALGWSADRARGRYVMVLDDDDEATPHLVARLMAYAGNNAMPDALIWRMDHGNGNVLPDSAVWHREPDHGHIGMSCWAVRNEIWQASAQHWPRAESGDFKWLSAVWPTFRRIAWIDEVLTRCQSGRSWGTTE